MSFDLDSKELEGLKVLSWEEGSQVSELRVIIRTAEPQITPPPHLVVKDVLTN